ncbi:MAG: hypothetical protein GX303_06620 [Clostridiales bacterium]|nr:hypothetical protein [Clostridiales bacterium]
MSSSSPTTQKLRYFTASNSAGGFTSYFDDIFSSKKFDRLYIIKGGPGTGKSYLMQQAAAKAEKNGYTVEYFYCSSDPLSLDGIAAYPTGEARALYGNSFIKKSFAIIDGTAPHARDTLLPGAGDEIINLGNFWNSNLLIAKRVEIEALNTQKSEFFIRAYEYLETANELALQIKRLILPAVDHEKMQGALNRIFKNIKPGEGFISAPRLRHALSMAGKASFDTFKNCAKKHYYVSECIDSAHLLFARVMKMAEERNLLTVYSPSPLSPQHLDGLYLPEAGIAFSLCEGRPELEENEKIINMERFVDLQKLRDSRTRLRLSKKYQNAMIHSAFECLSDARRAHFAIEKIYISAMNFKKKEIATEQLLSKIIPQ